MVDPVCLSLYDIWVEGQVDGLHGALFGASSTSSAPDVIEYAFTVIDLDCLYEAYLLADTTAYTFLGFYAYLNTFHASERVGDVLVDVPYHVPQAATWTAVADSHEVQAVSSM